jgi:hypothetical protein
MVNHSTIQRTNDNSQCVTLTTNQETLKEKNTGDL